MKSIKDFRSKQQSFDSEDSMRRASKLEPIKKSGKEKHSLYSRLDDDDDDDDDDDVELRSLRKRESAYDYFDDGEESDEEFDDDLDDEDDEEWDEEDEEADEEESDDAER